jgi:hypothetical protein
MLLVVLFTSEEVKTYDACVCFGEWEMLISFFMVGL